MTFKEFVRRYVIIEVDPGIVPMPMYNRRRVSVSQYRPIIREIGFAAFEIIGGFVFFGGIIFAMKMIMALAAI